MKRESAQALLVGTLGVVAAMSLAMLASHVSPILGFNAFFYGAFGGKQEIAETLASTTALLFPALGIAIAFRAGLFNIGAEGQLLIGGLLAGWLGTRIDVPPALAIAASSAIGSAIVARVCERSVGSQYACGSSESSGPAASGARSGPVTR